MKYVLITDGQIISNPMTKEEIISAFGSITKLEKAGILVREYRGGGAR